MTLPDPIRRGKELWAREGFLTFLRSASNWVIKNTIQSTVRLPVIDNICYSRTVSKLSERMGEEENLDDILDTAFQFSGYGRYKELRPQQVREEFKELAKEVERVDPDSILEIGTANGGSYYVWCQYINPEEIVCIDFSLAEKYIRFLSFIGGEIETTFLVENSLEEETVEMVDKNVNGEIDFVFVDGAGPYDAKMEDFENYKEYVSDGGIIAFHDIGNRPDSPSSGGAKFWNEVKENYETREIIRGPIGTHEGEECYMGIGIIYM